MNILPIMLLALITAQNNNTMANINNLYEEGRFKEAKSKLLEILTDETTEQSLLLQGLLESDGQKSQLLLTQFVNAFPQSNYLPRALFFIAQYQFLKGKYEKAIQTFKKIRRTASETQYSEKACLWIALCYLALRDKNNAILWHKKIEDKELQASNLAKSILVLENKKSRTYSIQTGSFTTKGTALQLLGSLKKKGYDTWLATTKKDGIKFYRVLIGQFDSRQKATGFSKLFSEKENLPFWIVSLKKL